MKTHQLIQGSREWHVHRAQHRNASDAPAMMGVSPHKTRSELLAEVATGITAEVGANTQRLFDDGHRTEALARPIAEQLIGEELYPVVGTNDQLSASFDGLTMLETQAFECKRLNARLRDAMHPGCTGASLPIDYQVQMEQQCMVADTCKRVLFVAAEFDRNGDLVEERHRWYTPNPDLAARIVAGWAQFEADLSAYVAPPAANPKPIGRTPETLPALHVEVTGMVTASNLDAFKEHAMAVFDAISRELTTDQHFADAADTVKWCADVEDRLDAAKQHALSQTESIDALFRTIDDVKAEARCVRLELAKLVEARKVAIRSEIVAEGIKDMTAHMAALVVRLGKPYMPAVPVDFGAAIKGKRTVDSLRDAVSTALASAKIEANAIADRIQMNLKAFDELDADPLLFPDSAQLVIKAADDFRAVVTTRIAAQKAKEDARLEAERARETPVAAPTPVAAQPAPAVAAVRALHAPQLDTRPPITTGTLCARLGDGITLTAAFIQGLGIAPAPRPAEAKNGTYWREVDFSRICQAIADRMRQVSEEVPA